MQPIFVIALAPVFAWLWLAMGRREPSSPAKFALGLLFGGLAFAILVPAAYVVVSGAKVGPYWLIGTYLLQTLGELCLSPVGLSAMTKLAPVRAAGFMMGIWFLSTSIGNWLAGKAASMYSSMPLPTSVRLGRRFQYRRRHRAGDLDQADGTADARREVGAEPSQLCFLSNLSVSLWTSSDRVP